jgi:hypothetical protein
MRANGFNLDPSFEIKIKDQRLGMEIVRRVDSAIRSMNGVNNKYIPYKQGEFNDALINAGTILAQENDSLYGWMKSVKDKEEKWKANLATKVTKTTEEEEEEEESKDEKMDCQTDDDENTEEDSDSDSESDSSEDEEEKYDIFCHRSEIKISHNTCFFDHLILAATATNGKIVTIQLTCDDDNQYLLQLDNSSNIYGTRDSISKLFHTLVSPGTEVKKTIIFRRLQDKYEIDENDQENIKFAKDEDEEWELRKLKDSIYYHYTKNFHL